MSALLLYTVCTALLLWVWDRFVQKVKLYAAIALMLLPLCFTERALLTGRIYAPVDLPFMSEPLKDYAKDYGVEKVHNGTLSDLYCQIIPWRSAVRHALANGEWPLWNPFMLCGDILAAAAQAAPYDPFNVIGLLIPLSSSLTFGAAMTFFLAGFFTFAFAREHELSEVPALAAAAAFMFNGNLAFFAGWPLARAWAFLPFVLFAVRRVIRERTLRAAVLLCASFVLLIFAGHPESILHVAFTGALYGAFELFAARTKPWRAIALAVGAGVIAFLLTAIVMMPFMAAAGETVEHRTRTELFAKADFFTNRDLIAKRAGVMFFPFFGGQPWRDNITPLWDPQTARVGSLALALAVAAVIFVRRKEVWFFFGLTVFALCAAFDAPPVAHLLHELPLFDMALNERLAYAASFALAMLAAFALEWALARRTAFVLIVIAIALGVATWMIQPSQLAAGVNASLIRELAIAELLPLAIAAILLLVRTRIAVPAILALILIQRVAEDGSIYPAIPQDSFYPRVPVIANIPKSDEPFRIVGNYYALIPDSAALYDLEDARGYEAMTYERLADTYPLWSTPQPVSFNLVSDLTKPFLSFLNVKYAFAATDTNPPDGWKLVHEDRQSRLFENTRVLPRAFVPRWIRYEQSETEVLRGMSAQQDFSERAWITVAEYEPHDIASGPGIVKTRADGNGFVLDVTMDLDGWVVITESAWRGWRVYLDDKRVEPRYANHAFLGVFVPKGKHVVKLRYVPEAFTRGRNITLATAVGLFLFAATRRIRRRRARR